MGRPLVADVIGAFDLRRNLAEVRVRVEGGEEIGLESYGQMVGRLVPVATAEALAENVTANAVQEKGLYEFRDSMREWLDAFKRGEVKILYLTFHAKRAIALIAVDLTA